MKKTLSQEEIGSRLAALEMAYVPNPISTAVIENLKAYREYVRARSRVIAQMSATQRRALKAHIKILPILGASGTGKSTAFREFIQSTTTDHDEEQGLRHVLEIQLKEGATPRTKYSDILDAYGDEMYDRGTKQTLMRRAHVYRIAADTDTWIFDEVNHMIDRDTAKTRWAVAESFKSLAESGVVGIVLVGQENVRDVIQNNQQLGHRCKRVIRLGPVNLRDPGMIKIAKDFFGAYSQRTVELGVIRERPDLAGEFFGYIVEVSLGRLGTGCVYVQETLDVALRAGAEKLTRTHFEAAKKGWADAHAIMSWHDPKNAA